jgi:hypothetical protein
MQQYSWGRVHLYPGMFVPLYKVKEHFVPSWLRIIWRLNNRKEKNILFPVDNKSISTNLSLIAEVATAVTQRR